MTKIKLMLHLGWIKEAVSSFIPTLFAYLDIFKEAFDFQKAIGLSILTFLLLFLILYFVKVKEYQSSVSRALANSYFKNFMEKLVGLLQSKGEKGIDFIFEDGLPRKFRPDDITVNVFLPDSYTDLKNKDADIRKSLKIAYIDTNAYNHPFFVCARMEGDQIIIHEVPRTLLSLKYFVDPQVENDLDVDKETRELYFFFNKEFRKLWTRLDRSNLHLNLYPG